MEKIIIERGRGKTTSLIKRAASLDGYNLIVCINRNQVKEIWKTIIEKKINLPMPITFDEFLKEKYYGMRVDNFLIDDADILLQSISRGVNIDSITLNKN